MNFPAVASAVADGISDMSNAAIVIQAFLRVAVDNQLPSWYQLTPLPSPAAALTGQFDVPLLWIIPFKYQEYKSLVAAVYDVVSRPEHVFDESTNGAIVAKLNGFSLPTFRIQDISASLSRRESLKRSLAMASEALESDGNIDVASDRFVEAVRELSTVLSP